MRGTLLNVNTQEEFKKMTAAVFVRQKTDKHGIKKLSFGDAVQAGVGMASDEMFLFRPVRGKGSEKDPPGGNRFRSTHSDGQSTEAC